MVLELETLDEKHCAAAQMDLAFFFETDSLVKKIIVSKYVKEENRLPSKSCNYS